MNMKISWALLVFVFVFCVAPQWALGKIIITEIMYDPAGTDTGREWIEIYNDSEEIVDMTQLRLFENNVAHTMKPHNAPAALLVGSAYAIVADNPEKFLIDFPTYAGLLIDSAFSLNNTGEPISIQSTDGVVDSTVTYSSEWGALGTDNSLQLSNDVWIPAKPTVGLVNADAPVDESAKDEKEESASDTAGDESSDTSSGSSSGSGNNSVSSHGSQSAVSTYKPKVTFQVSAGRNRYGFVNTPLSFKAEHNQDKTSGMKLGWSFGDGDYIRSKMPEHTYLYEGEYNVILNGYYQGKQSVSRTKVYIKTPKIQIKYLKRGELVDILLENGGEFEVNLGGYEIFLSDSKGERDFTIPPDTIISANSSIVLPYEYSKFKSGDVSIALIIRYPNRVFLAEAGTIQQ